MRVLCDTIDDFLQNLKESKGRIWSNAIWIDRSSNTLDNSTTSSVFIQVYCIVTLIDESEYLIQGGEACGNDYLDGEAEKEGTKRANDLVTKIVAYCNEVGLDVRPGTLEA